MCSGLRIANPCVAIPSTRCSPYILPQHALCIPCATIPLYIRSIRHVLRRMLMRPIFLLNLCMLLACSPKSTLRVA